MQIYTANFLEHCSEMPLYGDHISKKRPKHRQISKIQNLFFKLQWSRMSSWLNPCFVKIVFWMYIYRKADSATESGWWGIRQLVTVPVASECWRTAPVKRITCRLMRQKKNTRRANCYTVTLGNEHNVPKNHLSVVVPWLCTQPHN